MGVDRPSVKKHAERARNGYDRNMFMLGTRSRSCPVMLLPGSPGAYHEVPSLLQGRKRVEQASAFSSNGSMGCRPGCSDVVPHLTRDVDDEAEGRGEQATEKPLASFSSWPRSRCSHLGRLR